ncbi:ATP-dependent RNA helicase RhlB [Halopseudomonas xinjiangensis]|uniref:ATP-dependent RNA helicase RhlB n=1 Tax=Halopseudomonas xinjiangensis TaxID=487184 RepID=A0A1H1VQF8_9GAMM|nr:ATP-dependent RNA helicase RhlB [Halopseudomonas xinjiangensis]SDS87178.1 ATP-dependent RNA helicase RhlB [Halopseudomonas xinjiangensis]
MLKALKKLFKPGETPAVPQQPAAAEATQSAPAVRSQEPAEQPSSTGREAPPSRPKKPRQPAKPRAAKPVPPAPWSLEDFVVEPAEGKTRFHDFPLPDSLMRAIQDQGFSYCTPIQAKVLGSTLQGQDAIGRAQTGTGKTAAFLISTITQLLETPPPDERYMGEPRALIIAPTRELVMQIANDAEGLTKHCGLNVMAFVGGMDSDKQLKQLEKRYVDILVATPGRLLDFCNRGEVHLDLVEMMVLDEADRMLDMGFIPQVRQIIRQTPRKGDRQTLLFSATFSDDVMNLARQWTVDPAVVEIEPERPASENITQKVYAVSGADKYKVLYNLITQLDLERVMVFANRKDEVRRVQERLVRDGINAAQLSGDVPQHKRVRTLDNFREGKLRVLVATDVAGRGIHIDGISHVVNYTLPEDPEDYVHRIGRTGRAGAKGTSISLAGEDDAFQIPPIETLLGGKLDCIPPEEIYLKPIPRRQQSAEEKASSDANEAEQKAAADANRRRSSSTNRPRRR